jgi:uncharacterized protein involved in exopolysaccharide biosynthesis
LNAEYDLEERKMVPIICEMLESRRLCSGGRTNTAVYDDLIVIHQDLQVLRVDKEQLREITGKDRNKTNTAVHQCDTQIAADLRILKRDERKKSPYVFADFAKLKDDRQKLADILREFSANAENDRDKALEIIIVDRENLKRDRQHLRLDRNAKIGVPD